MKTRTNPIMKLITNTRRSKNMIDDDCESVTSTFSVEFTKNKSGPLERRVCFDESQNTCQEVAQVYAEDIPQLWYSADECAHMKGSNNFSIQAARRSASTGALEQVYRACYRGVITEHQQQSLSELLEVWGAARVGLEQKLLKSASKDRKNRREQLVSLAYNFKQQNPALSGDQLAVALSEKCAEISKPARLFAQQIAQAQQP